MTRTHDLNGLDVTVADGVLRRRWGWRGRRDVSGEALVLAYPGVADRTVGMIGVRTPLDVVWCVGHDVWKTEQLAAWTGMAVGRASAVVELPPGTVDGWGVDKGDRLEVPA